MNSADPFSSRFEVFGREHKNTVEGINQPAFEKLKRVLNVGERGDGRVILLRAPRAGYGKTSLLQRVAAEFDETHHFVRVNLVSGRTTDAAHVLEYVLQALCQVLPDSTTLTKLDLLARRVLALGLEPLVASGEVPCQDREGALLALREQPTETFDFHHDRAVTAHWTKSNFEILGPRLAAELARESGASLREASYWVELLFRFSTTAPDNVERARLLFETVFRGDLQNQSESAAEERLHGLLALFGTVTNLVLIVDDTEGLSTAPADALALASFLTNMSQCCPGTLVLLSVNDDIWRSAFLPLLPGGLADRLMEYDVVLKPLSEEEAIALVSLRAGDRADDVLEKIEWGSGDLYARQVLKKASDAWEELDHEVPVLEVVKPGAEKVPKEVAAPAPADENDILADLPDLDDEEELILDQDDGSGEVLAGDDTLDDPEEDAADEPLIVEKVTTADPVESPFAASGADVEKKEEAASEPIAVLDISDHDSAKSSQEEAPDAPIEEAISEQVENPFQAKTPVEPPTGNGLLPLEESESPDAEVEANPFTPVAKTEDEPSETALTGEQELTGTTDESAQEEVAEPESQPNPFLAGSTEAAANPFFQPVETNGGSQGESNAPAPIQEPTVPASIFATPAEATAETTESLVAENGENPFLAHPPTSLGNDEAAGTESETMFTADADGGAFPSSDPVPSPNPFFAPATETPAVDENPFKPKFGQPLAPPASEGTDNSDPGPFTPAPPLVDMQEADAVVLPDTALTPTSPAEIVAFSPPRPLSAPSPFSASKSPPPSISEQPSEFSTQPTPPPLTPDFEPATENESASPFSALGGAGGAEKNLEDVSSIFAPIDPTGGDLDPAKIKPITEQPPAFSAGAPPQVNPFQAGAPAPAFAPPAQVPAPSDSSTRPAGQPPALPESQFSAPEPTSIDAPNSINSPEPSPSPITAFNKPAEPSEAEPPAPPVPAPDAETPEGEAPSETAPVDSPFRPAALTPVESSSSPFAKGGGVGLSQRTELPPKKESSANEDEPSPFEPGQAPSFEGSSLHAAVPTPTPTSAPAAPSADGGSPFAAVGAPSSKPVANKPEPEPATAGSGEGGDQDKVDELLRQFKERYGRK